MEDPEWYKSAGRYFEICTKIRSDTSGATSVGYLVKSSKKRDKDDFEELYSD